MSAPKIVKLPVDERNCGNCANARRRPLGGRMHGTDLECRWEGPPWTDKGVLATDWCRRWTQALTPPKPIVKEPDHV